MVNPVGAGLWVDGEGGARSRAVVATTYQPEQKYFTTVIFDPLLPRTRAPGSHLTWRHDTSGPLRKGHLSWSIWLGGPVGRYESTCVNAAPSPCEEPLRSK